MGIARALFATIATAALVYTTWRLFDRNWRLATLALGGGLAFGLALAYAFTFLLVWPYTGYLPQDLLVTLPYVGRVPPPWEW